MVAFEGAPRGQAGRAPRGQGGEHPGSNCGSTIGAQQVGSLKIPFPVLGFELPPI